MTIKEIEDLSGMTRANIRFYEKEGLIKPQRDSNGYRNYSRGDLDLLKRIRLLRMLHLSLEDIKSLSRNDQDLAGLLMRHLNLLRKEHKNLEQSMAVCEQLCKDHASYENFDAQHYLDLLTLSPEEMQAELREDTVPKVTSPWVRYFARSLDLCLYMTLWDALLALAFHINITEMRIAGIILNIVVPVCLLLIIEPVMLSRFGTTPGKFVFGLRVTAETGARLTHREALFRTWIVIKKGFGFFIPIYYLVREYKSYKACKNGETLDWEEETLLWLDEGRVPLGILATIVGMIFFNAADLMIWQAGALPQNGGNLTVAEYAENFNNMEKFYQIDRQLNLPEYTFIPDSRLILNEEGAWEKLPSTPYINRDDRTAPLPDLKYTVENGILTGVSFSASFEKENIEIASYGDLMAVTALSYICAQEDYSLLPAPPSLLYLRILENGNNFTGFTFTEAGVNVQCTIRCSGYALRQAEYASGNVLIPEYGSEPLFYISFSVEQTS